MKAITLRVDPSQLPVLPTVSDRTLAAEIFDIRTTGESTAKSDACSLGNSMMKMVAYGWVDGRYSFLSKSLCRRLKTALLHSDTLDQVFDAYGLQDRITRNGFPSEQFISKKHKAIILKAYVGALHADDQHCCDVFDEYNRARGSGISDYDHLKGCNDPHSRVIGFLAALYHSRVFSMDELVNEVIGAYPRPVQAIWRDITREYPNPRRCMDPGWMIALDHGLDSIDREVVEMLLDEGGCSMDDLQDPEDEGEET